MSADANQHGNVWREYTGQVAWPTLGLLAFILSAEAVLWWAALTERLSAWVGFFPAVILGYLAFTVMHEAGHGNIHGNNPKRKWVGELAGWLSGAVLLAPLPAFRVLHNLHHSHTNDPQRDPDHWVVGQGALSVALRCLTIFPHYYWDFLVGPASQSRPAKTERTVVVVGMTGYALLALLGVAMGYGPLVLGLWVAPAVVSCGVLAFVFDWMPHHPHGVQRRLHDTRVLLFPGLGLLTLGQSYHLIHHLWPRVPFYSYGACFYAVRPWLEAQGAAIEGLEVHGAPLTAFGDSPVMRAG